MTMRKFRVLVQSTDGDPALQVQAGWRTDWIWYEEFEDVHDCMDRVEHAYMTGEGTAFNDD